MNLIKANNISVRPLNLQVVFRSYLKFLCVVKFSLKDLEVADHRYSTKCLF